MNPISTKYDWKQITPQNDDKHYFFGYYDRNPWNDAIDRHLCLKIDQAERLPEPGETAEIGLLDGTGAFEPVTTTRAWCHQQGSMELFIPGTNDFVTNDFDGEKVVAIRYRLGVGEVGRYEKPIYCISPNGKYAASLDFARIPRRGYSYACAPLPPNEHPLHPDEEGLFLIELATGKTTLVASYTDMMAKHPWGYSAETRRLWLNHAIFNCDSSKLLWLFRQCRPPQPGDRLRWHTFMFTSTIFGEDLACTLPYVYWDGGKITHQIWGRTPNEILIDANWDGDGAYPVVYDDTVRPFLAHRIAKTNGYSGHLVFSPDKNFLLADTYPHDGIQYLTLVNANTGECEELGRFNHVQPQGTIVDVRCDLHPRWSKDGKKITVDSIHNGRRAVYMLEL